MNNLHLIILQVFQTWLVVAQKPIVVNTKLGKIKGTTQTASNGDTYEAYMGVPYAQPPVGDLRWTDTVPVQPWGDMILDATRLPEQCLQHNPYNARIIVGSEDCLYLNVYTRSGDADKKHTFVFVHGGLFNFGSSLYYNPSFFMSHKGVIVVSIQFRKHALGFMSTEDDVAPGNYGLLDQLEALKWVQENIESFGGDPDKVTLVGVGSGAASVSYLTMSPRAVDKYMNSMLLSGSALPWWANLQNPSKRAKELGKHFNCPTSNSLSMIVCLKKISGHDLMKAQVLLFFPFWPQTIARAPTNVFSPRSDPERQYPVMPQEPYVRLKNGDIHPKPQMIGFTCGEGGWRAGQLLPQSGNGGTWSFFKKNYVTVAPYVYGFLDGFTKDPKGLVNKVTQQYGLSNTLMADKLTDNLVQNFVDLIGDSSYKYPIIETARLRAAHGIKNLDTYVYKFKYPGKISLANFDNGGSFREAEFQPLKGATHGSDLFLMMNTLDGAIPIPEKDVKASNQLISLLINFGKTNKNQWKPLDLRDPTYLLMEENYTVKKGLPGEERMDFWRSLPSLYWSYNTKNL